MPDNREIEKNKEIHDNAKDREEQEPNSITESPEQGENVQDVQDNAEKAEAEEENDESVENTDFEKDKEAASAIPASIWQRVMASVLFLALILLCALGMYQPLRPSYSESEKRMLMTMPAISIRGIWSGDFFKELSGWYSDSFPFRELLLDGSSRLESLYGLKGEAVYIRGEQSIDEIPVGEAELAPTVSLSDLTAEAGEAEHTDSQGEEHMEQQSDVEFETDADGNLLIPKEEPVQEIAGERAGNIYVADNRAYELFYFNQKNVSAYASMLNTVKSRLPDIMLYDMIVPNSYAVQLDGGTQARLASSGIDTAISYTYSLMIPDILRVPVFETLSEHRDEYIYFHTDHHWTQLGAYYAYLEFCSVKGISPHELSDFESVSYDGFYGTFYFSTNRAEALKQNPDTIEAWIPASTNEMLFRSREGELTAGHIINDGSAMLSGNRYNTFILGDNAYTEIENPTLSDGSSIAVIKESYGNAFAPFLADHYQHVYVIDYRYYKDNLTELIEEKGIRELLFLNNIMALGQRSASEMLGLFG